MTYESMKFTNFNQLRKYSNFSESDNDKTLALKSNLGKLLQSDMYLIEKISPRKNKRLKILDDIEEEEMNKKFYDNFLNNLYSKEKRFKTKSNHKYKQNNSNNYIPIQKKISAKLLRFNNSKYRLSLMNNNHKIESTKNLYYKKNKDYNKKNINNDIINEKENIDYYNNKKNINNSNSNNSIISNHVPSTFEKQLEIEEKEKAKQKEKEKKEKKEEEKEIEEKEEEEKEEKKIEEKELEEKEKEKEEDEEKEEIFKEEKKQEIIENNYNNRYSKLIDIKKSSISNQEQFESKNESYNKLKFLQKEIPYMTNEDKKNEINIQTLGEKKSNKNSYISELEGKKQELNINPTNDKGYTLNTNNEQKRKKFCFCCIPII